MDESKFTFIFSGKEGIKARDGQVESFGIDDGEITHAFVLCEYLRKYFPHIKAFDNITERVDVHTAAYVLNQLGMIVFMNVTSYSKKLLKQYGYSGILLMPKEITEAQKSTLLAMSEKLSKYYLQINYDSTINKDGFIERKMIESSNIGSCDIIEYYLDNFVKTKQK